MAQPEKERIGLSLPAPLVKRLHDEAEQRVVGEALLVQRALEAYFPNLPPVTPIDQDAPRPKPS